ncbi:hypothetical protein AB0M48_30240 [Lentzea sp. NPDC051208]|uniref:hypothetical protein n=1 Tax=Lentzea sp. NPDC051208 TaxID=3154642 RepID=UPI003414C2A4
MDQIGHMCRNSERTRGALSISAGMSLLALLVMISACNADTGADCTVMGAPAGIAVQVEHTAVAAVDVKACWDATCVATTVRPEPGHGETTGEIAQVTDIPARPVTVEVSATAANGATTAVGTVTVNPVPLHPNGPQCPATGNRAKIIISADGTVLAG